jgi:serine/threonine protein kinase
MTTRFFDKFEILDCIKKDTHSSVYVARHIYLGKKIVLKTLEIFPDQDVESLQRFKREARILARLDHPNIIKILDFGMSKNQAYLSFEYFESEDLCSYLKNRQLQIGEKTDLFQQLVQGLEAAHSGNIIHRDLKPENILINRDGQLKIADFGLAILQDETKVTNKSSIVGTPAYMSPEQIRGESLTNRSDLFTLGIIGFELFLGYNPFTGKDINETINAILSYDEDELAKNLSQLNSPLQEILKKLLKREPFNRGTATETLSMMGAEMALTVTTQPMKFRFLRLVLPFALILVGITVMWVFMSNNKNEHIQKEPVLTQKGNDSSEYVYTEISPIEKIVQPIKETYGIFLFEIQPAADVFINDNLQISGQMNGSLSLAPGNYDIRLMRAGYPSYSQTVTIRESELTSMKVNLDSLFGYFACQVHPWGDIHINNQYIGQTPLLKRTKLIPGRYSFRVENPNYEIFEDSIEIKSGKTTFVQLNLEKMSSHSNFK